MSRSLMHTEYHATEYTATVGATGHIRSWLAEHAERATPSQCASLLIADKLVAGMDEDNEPYTIERDEALDIARALRTEIADVSTTATSNETSLREHIGELADAIEQLAQQHEVLHLSLI